VAAGCKRRPDGSIRYAISYPGTGFYCKVVPAALKERPHTLLKVIEFYEERAGKQTQA
jgi:hypothetical protein